MRVITNAMLQTSVFDVWCGLFSRGTLFVWASILIAFRYSLRVLKINNSRYIYYRFSILAVNNGMQRLFGDQFHFRVDTDWGSPVWESKPLEGQTRLGVRRLGVNTVWGSEITLEFRGHFGSIFGDFFRKSGDLLQLPPIHEDSPFVRLAEKIHKYLSSLSAINLWTTLFDCDELTINMRQQRDGIYELLSRIC